MREILFRGKRIDNGKWVEGGYWVNDTITRQTTHIIDYDGNAHTVDPSTIGQYTGLTDKNDAKIFEGDIVCAKTEDTKRSVNAIVKFGLFKDPNNDEPTVGWYLDSEGYTYSLVQDCDGKALNSCIEVIGNIHDKPRLREEAPHA